MQYVVLASLSLFLLITSVGMLLYRWFDTRERMGAVLRPSHRSESQNRGRTGARVRAVVDVLERIVPRTPAETSVVKQRLIRAGYRGDSAIKFLYALKCLTPALCCLMVSQIGVKGASAFLFYAGALGIGFLLPDFWIDQRIKSRQAKIRRGMPDALDMLVICLEAGLGMDESTARTANEIRLAHRVLSQELDLLVLEHRAGRLRSDAWRNMAQRTDVAEVQNLVSILAQSEKYGTSLANTLKTHAETMRTRRVQQVEERAAKTTVKLVFPLVLFIFPSLFLVTLGPAAILISEQFKEMLK